jgi:hypothetical protein
MIRETSGKPILRHFFKARGNHNSKVGVIIHIDALFGPLKGRGLKNQQRECDDGYKQIFQYPLAEPTKELEHVLLLIYHQNLR